MKHLLWLFLGLPVLLIAQSDPNRTKGVMIMTDAHLITEIVKNFNEFRNSSTLEYKSLGQNTDIYLLTSDLDDVSLYQWCLSQKYVLAVELNYEISKRQRPNDQKVAEQYHLDFIKAFDAWNMTTGGKDYKGDEIVIGVVDDGFDINHEDLIKNIFTNSGEVAGDNKDNDGNGYIDDINGWNQRIKSGTHDLKSHGTNILGVMGAEGNNLVGISGVNWSIKLLPVTTGNFVSDVIESYNYLLAMKKAYNTSNGGKGANIKVASYSGGLPKAFAKDHPIWCDIYDKLGAEGVLSVAATTNEEDDVDVVGDMPSTCTSPYLLIVSSTNKNDQKDVPSGYGALSVDISAPGEKILTTELTTKGKYKVETGTSLSTPMVAGAAALLYSIKCSLFYDFVKNQKAESVLAIKNALIEGVDPKSSLKNKTVSGGRLNIANSIDIILDKYCGRGPLAIRNISLTQNLLKVDYTTPNNEEVILKLYDSTGKEVVEHRLIPPNVAEKSFSFTFDGYFSGLYYFISLISGKEIVSKGFTVKDVTK